MTREVFMGRFICRLGVVVATAVGIGFGLFGCGSNAPVALPETGATLEGTIKYGSEELQYSNVIIRSGEKGVAMGVILDDGRYRVENVPLGEVKVGVMPRASYGRYMSDSMAGGAYKGPEGKGRGKVNLKFIDVPEKFYDPEQSGITTTINQGENTFDIVIPKGKDKEK